MTDRNGLKKDAQFKAFQAMETDVAAILACPTFTHPVILRRVTRLAPMSNRRIPPGFWFALAFPFGLVAWGAFFWWLL